MKLEELIAETLRLNSDIPIVDSCGPGQLDGWDSLGHVSLIVAIESEYNISISLDEVMNIETVADIKRILDSKGVDYL